MSKCSQPCFELDQKESGTSASIELRAKEEMVVLESLGLLMVFVFRQMLSDLLEKGRYVHFNTSHSPNST